MGCKQVHHRRALTVTHGTCQFVDQRLVNLPFTLLLFEELQQRHWQGVAQFPIFLRLDARGGQFLQSGFHQRCRRAFCLTAFLLQRGGLLRASAGQDAGLDHPDHGGQQQGALRGQGATGLRQIGMQLPSPRPQGSQQAHCDCWEPPA